VTKIHVYITTKIVIMPQLNLPALTKSYKRVTVTHLQELTQQTRLSSAVSQRNVINQSWKNGPRNRRF